MANPVTEPSSKRRRKAEACSCLVLAVLLPAWGLPCLLLQRINRQKNLLHLQQPTVAKHHQHCGVEQAKAGSSASSDSEVEAGAAVREVDAETDAAPLELQAGDGEMQAFHGLCLLPASACQ